MRRALASLLLGLSLVVATVAWSGFVMLRTVLDPGRSERLADEMLDNTLVQGVLVDAVATAIERQLPPEAAVPRQDLEAAAAAALDDPRVETLVRDGMVRVHQNALEGVDEPVVLDPTAFGSATRDALVATRPDVAAVLPAAPPLPVTLPNAGLSVFGTLRSLLQQAVLAAGAVAAAGALLAMVVARDRPSVLRRIALWALAASAFWLIVGFGVPWLAERFVPSSAAAFTAAVQVFLGAMIPPAVVLAGAGVALVAASIAWDAASAAATRGAGGGRARRPRPGPLPTAGPAPGGPVRPAGRPRPAPAVADGTRVMATPGPAAGPWATEGRTRAWSGAAEPWASPGAGPGGADPWDLTAPAPVPGRPRLPRSDPWAVTEPGGPEDPGPAHGPRWVEGVGYVDD